jgi:type I restriction enzyme S subunit
MNFSDRRYAIGRGLAAIRHKKEKHLQPFVKGLIDLILPGMLQNVTGSTFPNLSKEQLNNYEIEIPGDLSTQTQIASILSSLDDKIELNRRTNQTLEQIAQTLFKKYFVDDIDPENLPEGWRWGKLGEMYKTTSGGTPSRVNPEYYENGKIGWVKSKELDGGFILDTEEKITIDALKNSSAKLLPIHSVLVAMYGATVGEIATLSIEATCNQAICAILPSIDYPYSFILQFLKLNKEELINRASGSAQQNISQLVIQNFELAIPPSVLVQEFHKVVGDLFLKIENNLKENKSLSETRDSLLPKLMSGEIEINATEKELVSL